MNKKTDKKPLIGVVPLIDYERESLWMVPGYMDGISRAGGLPMILPLTENRADIKRLCGLFDGFLFTGGQDVTPSFYGKEQLQVCGQTSPERDKMEAELLGAALAADKPVLGICRGIQFINAALGGTLYQDLPTEHPSDINHHQAPPYDVPAHEDMILKETPLYDVLEDLLQDGKIPVNSYHHSAVKELSPKLCTMAWSTDGVAEAVYSPEYSFLWAVQWHPEFDYEKNEASRRIFGAFVNAACRLI